MDGVVVVSMRGGALLYAKAVYPNFGLSSDHSIIPCNLGALLFALYLESSCNNEKEPSSSSMPMELPSTLTCSLGESIVQFTHDGSHGVLVAVLLRDDIAGISEELSSALSKEFIYTFHDTILGNAVAFGTSKRVFRQFTPLLSIIYQRVAGALLLKTVLTECECDWIFVSFNNKSTPMHEKSNSRLEINKTTKKKSMGKLKRWRRCLCSCTCSSSVSSAVTPFVECVIDVTNQILKPSPRLSSMEKNNKNKDGRNEIHAELLWSLDESDEALDDALTTATNNIKWEKSSWRISTSSYLEGRLYVVIAQPLERSPLNMNFLTMKGAAIIGSHMECCTYLMACKNHNDDESTASTSCYSGLHYRLVNAS